MSEDSLSCNDITVVTGAGVALMSLFIAIGTKNNKTDFYVLFYDPLRLKISFLEGDL